MSFSKTSIETVNTANEEIVKIRKDKEEFEKKVRKKFLEIRGSSDFYKESPFLSIANELLLSLKEGLISELTILSATTDKAKRKRNKFQKTFGKFSNAYLETIGRSVCKWE